MFAEIRDTRLFYDVRGSGAPLMLMHGGLGLDHSWFRPWFDELHRRARVVYYDHRGNGRSERLQSFEGLTHETWVADADALRQFLGLDQMVLFGHSYGGFLAQEYALRYQDRLKGLVLCCTAPVVDYMEVIQANAAARGTPDQVEAVEGALSRPLADDAEFERSWLTLLPLYFKGEVPPRFGEGASYSADAWNHVNANCLPAFDVRSRLGTVEVPTLVISGEHDWITPPAQGGQRIHEALSRSEHVVFEDSGHYPFVEETERFSRLLGDWLEGL